MVRCYWSWVDLGRVVQPFFAWLPTRETPTKQSQVRLYPSSCLAFANCFLGDITYGGIPAKRFERYMGETIYTAEEDVHFPTLTVRQTLTAALKCKVPHKRANGQTRKVFVDRVMNMLLQIFGLTKQVDTVCGRRVRMCTRSNSVFSSSFTASWK